MAKIEIGRKYFLQDVIDKLDVGMWIESNGNGSDIHGTIKGMIGEKSIDTIYIFNDTHNGGYGNISPITKGFKYSWQVSDKFTNTAWIIVTAIPIVDAKCSCGKKGHAIIKCTAYCKKCVTDNFKMCSNCGYYHAKADNLTYNGIDYCKKCYDLLYFKCCECDEMYPRRVLRFSSTCQKNYCDECYHDNFIQCNWCGREVYKDDAYYDDDRATYKCESCHNRIVNDASYQPFWHFHKLAFENTLFMGLELEIEADGDCDINDTAQDIQYFLKKKKHDKFYYFKEDSSLGHGFEIVTQPFTLQYSHKHFGFYDLLKFLQKTGCTSYTQNSCGIHVHISRKFFKPKEIRKLRLFFSQNQNMLFKFSKRTDTEFCHYEDYNMGLYKKRYTRQGGRYNAVNLNTGKDTVEIRIFRGSLYHGRFIAILQFCDAICHYIKETSAIEMAHDNAWDNFINWTHKKGRYNHFVKHARVKNLYGKSLPYIDNIRAYDEDDEPCNDFED